MNPSPYSSNVLSAAEMLKIRSDFHPVLPAKGVKEFEPSGSWLESKQIRCALEERKTLLEERKIDRINYRSAAEWKPDLSLALVTRRSGGHYDVMGHEEGGELWLNAEEILLLLEMNRLEVWFGGVPMSVEQGYTVLLSTGTGCTLEEYTVYKHLNHLGYRIVRHRRGHDVTQYETDIRLDQFVQQRSNTVKEVLDAQRRTSCDEVKEQDVIRVDNMPAILMEEDPTQENLNTATTSSVEVTDSEVKLSLKREDTSVTTSTCLISVPPESVPQVMECDDCKTTIACTGMEVDEQESVLEIIKKSTEEISGSIASDGCEILCLKPIETSQANVVMSTWTSVTGTNENLFKDDVILEDWEEKKASSSSGGDDETSSPQESLQVFEDDDKEIIGISLERDSVKETLSETVENEGDKDIATVHQGDDVKEEISVITLGSPQNVSSTLHDLIPETSTSNSLVPALLTVDDKNVSTSFPLPLVLTAQSGSASSSVLVETPDNSFSISKTETETGLFPSGLIKDNSAPEVTDAHEDEKSDNGQNAFHKDKVATSHAEESNRIASEIESPQNTSPSIRQQSEAQNELPNVLLMNDDEELMQMTSASPHKVAPVPDKVTTVDSAVSNPSLTVVTVDEDILDSSPLEVLGIKSTTLPTSATKSNLEFIDYSKLKPDFNVVVGKNRCPVLVDNPFHSKTKKSSNSCIEIIDIDSYERDNQSSCNKRSAESPDSLSPVKKSRLVDISDDDDVEDRGVIVLSNTDQGGNNNSGIVQQNSAKEEEVNLNLAKDTDDCLELDIDGESSLDSGTDSETDSGSIIEVLEVDSDSDIEVVDADTSKRKRLDNVGPPAKRAAVIEVVDLSDESSESDELSSDEEVSSTEETDIVVPPRRAKHWTENLAQDQKRMDILKSIPNTANKSHIVLNLAGDMVPPECHPNLKKRVNLYSLGAVGWGGKPDKNYRPAHQIMEERQLLEPIANYDPAGPSFGGQNPFFNPSQNFNMNPFNNFNMPPFPNSYSPHMPFPGPPMYNQSFPQFRPILQPRVQNHTISGIRRVHIQPMAGQYRPNGWFQQNNFYNQSNVEEVLRRLSDIKPLFRFPVQRPQMATQTRSQWDQHNTCKVEKNLGGVQWVQPMKVEQDNKRSIHLLNKTGLPTLQCGVRKEGTTTMPAMTKSQRKKARQRAHKASQKETELALNEADNLLQRKSFQKRLMDLAVSCNPSKQVTAPLLPTPPLMPSLSGGSNHLASVTVDSGSVCSNPETRTVVDSIITNSSSLGTEKNTVQTQPDSIDFISNPGNSSEEQPEEKSQLDNATDSVMPISKQNDESVANQVSVQLEPESNRTLLSAIEVLRQRAIERSRRFLKLKKHKFKVKRKPIRSLQGRARAMIESVDVSSDESCPDGNSSDTHVLSENNASEESDQGSSSSSEEQQDDSDCEIINSSNDEANQSERGSKDEASRGTSRSEDRCSGDHGSQPSIVGDESQRAASRGSVESSGEDSSDSVQDDSSKSDNDAEETTKDMQPLLQPGDCTDYATILSRLDIIKPAGYSLLLGNEETCSKYKYSFDVYKPPASKNSAPFRKSVPGIPDYRIIVLSVDEPVPTAVQVAALKKTNKEDVPVLFAVVCLGSVSFLQLNNVELPVDLEDYSATNATD